jgi:hypothetical protein
MAGVKANPKKRKGTLSSLLASAVHQDGVKMRRGDSRENRGHNLA